MVKKGEDGWRNFFSVFLCFSWCFSSCWKAEEMVTRGAGRRRPRAPSPCGHLSLDRLDCRGVRACLCPLPSKIEFSSRLCRAVLPAALPSVSNCSAECKFHTADHSHINYPTVSSLQPTLCWPLLAACCPLATKKTHLKTGRSVLMCRTVAAFLHLR